MRQFSIVLLGNIVGLFFLSAHASPMGNFWQKTRGHYSVGLDIAYSQNPINHSAIISPPVPELENQQFISKSSSNTFNEYGLQFAYHIPIFKRWSLETGINYFFSGQQKVVGQYYTTPIPPADQTYQFNFSTRRLMLSTALTYEITKKWLAFGRFSLGEVTLQTTALNFTSIKNPGGLSQPLTSSPQNNSHLGYAVSLGMQYKLDTKWSFKLGLNRAWLGSLEVPVDNGVSTFEVSLGQINPWQLRAGTYYQF